MSEKKITSRKRLPARLRQAARRIAIPAALAAGAFIGFAAADKNDDHLFEISKNMEIFGNVYQQLNKLYVDEPQPGALMKTGIDAMLNSLDPYTNYIPEEQIEDYRFQSSGQYAGIGAQVRMINNRIVVTEPREGFPAQKAGIKAGDVVLEINGTSAKGKTVEQMGKLLKGLPGTAVKIKVERPGETKPVDFSLTLEEIKAKNVTHYSLIGKNIGYIRLDNFMENAATEVREALVDLKQQGAVSIVLDLRENPGGLLREAVSIVNLFVDRGQLVVNMRGRVKEWDKQFRTESAPVDTEIPLAVLVNAWSASASEIVAGSLQDLDRAVVVGQRSYGKGLVQQTVPLIYGSLFKVTVAKYYTPSGRCVQSIDYSHRKADGTLERVPDSLITAFKTKNGRIVWDGLGVIPDLEIPERKYSVLTDTLLAKGLIFDYATAYAQKHATIEKADKFQLSDAEYEEFVNWVKAKDYAYYTKEESDLKAFRSHAEKSGSFASLSTEFDALEKKAQSGKAGDFTRFKAEIKLLLESEIVSRYYYQAGRVAASLKDDPDLKQAISTITDAAAYRKVLTEIVQKPKPLQRADIEKRNH